MPHVALIVETSTAYGRAILSGISQYRPRTRTVDGLYRAALATRPGAAMAGAVGRRRDHRSCIDTTECSQAAQDRRADVDLNDQVRGLGLPQIHSDHAAIARLAAEHLIERGFRHFAYFGFPVFEWSVRRQESFTACVSRSRPPDPRGPARSPRRLEPSASLMGRRDRGCRPLGEEACPSRWGSWPATTSAASRCSTPAGGRAWPCPRKSAVVGVDNEELVCLLAYPPLSSVIPDAFRDRLRSRRLARSHDGGPASHRNVAIDPPSERRHQAVIGRDGDRQPVPRQAMRFIREHACAGIGVDDVLEHLTSHAARSSACSARRLGQTILDAITAIRMQRVKQLLTETDLSLADSRRPRRFFVRGVPEHELPTADRTVSRCVPERVQDKSGEMIASTL